MEINKEELDLDDLQYFTVYVMYNLISQTCGPYKVPHKTSFLELIFKKYGNKSHLTREGFKMLIKKLKIGIQEDHNLNSVHQIMTMRNKDPHNNHDNDKVGRYFESHNHHKHEEPHHSTIHDGHVHNHRDDTNDRHDLHKPTHANHYEKHGDHYDYYNHEKMKHSRHEDSQDHENDEKSDFEEPRRENGRGHEESRKKHIDNDDEHDHQSTNQDKHKGNNDDHLEHDHHESHKHSEKDEDDEYDQDNKGSPQVPEVEEITEKKTNISDNSNQQSSDEHDHSDHDHKKKKRSIDEDIFATREEETKHARQRRSLSKNSKVSLLPSCESSYSHFIIITSAIKFRISMKRSVLSILTLISCYTAQKMKFSIKEFFSKCDQIRNFPRIWSHLLKKYLIENFIFLQCEFLPNPECTT